MIKCEFMQCCAIFVLGIFFHPWYLHQILGYVIICVVGNLFILDHDSVKKLFDTVGVPLADGKFFSNLFILIQQLDNWIRSTHVLDREARVPRWSLALYERRDLRVGPQSSSAHLKNCLLPM